MTKAKKIEKTVGFPGNFCTKLFELLYDFTVKFSPILKETFGQITAKEQIIIKLELASLS